VLDHVFPDAIGALRDAMESAFLERQAFEERFQADVLLGDLTWETSYSLPGEGVPPRTRADITMDWPTWAQTAYRSWYIGEELDEAPRIEIEIVMRVQRLKSQPDVASILAVLPDESTSIGGETLQRSSPTLETIFDADLSAEEFAVEVSYEGSYDLEEEVLADGSALDAHFAGLGGWIASTLVRLGDLTFDYLPPEED
jgi:hypothetical protein